MPSPCVFCNISAEAWSEEHVIPKWLLEYLQISAQDQMFQGLAVSGGKEVTKQRIHASRRLVEGRVCAGCNNGWMSRLEDAAKSTLIELIENKRALWELTADESAVLAKWAVKSSYLLANVSLAGKPVPVEHLWQLCGDDGQIPEGVGVFGFQIAYDQNVSFLQIPAWPQLLANGQTPQSTQEPPGAYKVVWQFRSLILLVARYSVPPSQLVTVSGLHVPIWPNRLLWPSYVNRQLGSFSSSLPTIKAFAESLAFAMLPAPSMSSA